MKNGVMVRYVTDFVIESLKKRAVFIGGPRQVGKTTLALSLISPKADARHGGYLNWDYEPSAEKIRKSKLPIDHLGLKKLEL